MSENGYHPNVEEVTKAEMSLTEEEKLMSKIREYSISHEQKADLGDTERTYAEEGHKGLKKIVERSCLNDLKNGYRDQILYLPEGETLENLERIWEEMNLDDFTANNLFILMASKQIRNFLNESNFITVKDEVEAFLEKYPNERIRKYFDEANKILEDNGVNWLSCSEILYSNLLKWIEIVDYRQMDTFMESVGVDKGNLGFMLNIRNAKRNAVRSIREYEEFINTLIETRISAEKIDGSDQAVSELEDDQVAENLSFREKLLTQFIGLDRRVGIEEQDSQISSFCENVTSDSPSISRHSLDAYSEQQLFYGILLLSPKNSTTDLIGAVSESLSRAVELSDVLRGYYVSEDDLQFYSKLEAARVELAMLFREINLMNGVNVFEVGGSQFANNSKTLGANNLGAADAGHSSYGFGYGAGNVDNMIQVSNYQNFIAPHTADLVVSSRLFDGGSGIGNIAEGAKDERSKDAYGSAEMTLVLANAIKDGGFMIHFDGPPPKDYMGITGFKVIYDSPQAGQFSRYHHSADGVVKNNLQLGKKSFAFSQESRTWESKN